MSSSKDMGGMGGVTAMNSSPSGGGNGVDPSVYPGMSNLTQEDSFNSPLIKLSKCLCYAK